MATPDISRQLFQPEKRYIGTFMQQGRVVTDEDLNAHRRLDAEDERLTFRDIICAKGSPNHGFRIGAPTPVDLGLDRSGYDFPVADGSFYIGGLRFESLADQAESYLTQRDWLQIDVDPAALPLIPSVADLTDPNGGTLDRFDLVYLRGWEQCVSAVEDRELLEYALGGPDTSVFRRRQRRIEVLAGVTGDCSPAFGELIDHLTAPLPGDGSGNPHPFDEESCELLSKARLTVGFTGGPPSDDLCQPPVLGGYLGAENQAIRVQLTATNRFIWGFDNAAPLYRVQFVEEEGLNVIRFLTLPRDEFAQPVSGQAVEILPWGALLPNHEKTAEWQGHLTTVATGFDPDTGRITIEAPVPQAWLDWMNDPAHAGFLNDRDEPAAQRYFYLRVWTGGSGDAAQPDFSFVPGHSVPLADTGLEVTFSDFGLPGSYWVIAARPNTPDEVVPWILTEDAPAFGPRQFIASLALIRWSIDPKEGVVGSVVDCRSRFRPLCQLKGCCTIIVGDGSASHGEFTSIQDAVDALPPAGGEVCVLRGRYEEHIRIANRVNIKIRGCGRDTRIIAQNDAPVIEIIDSQGIVITELAIEALAAPGILCHGSDPFGGIRALARGEVRDITLTRLSILSRDLNSVAVFRGRSVTFAHSEVRVFALEEPLGDEGQVGRQPAVFLQGTDLLIEGNRILAERARVAQSGYGGLQIGGGSARVEIRRNLIRGGNNNGITLGNTVRRSVKNFRPEDSFAISLRSPVGLRIRTNSRGCTGIDPFPPRPEDNGGGDTVLEAGPALRDIRIVDNSIEGMGMSGIAVDHFFDMDEHPDFITVRRLTIECNRITGCMRLELDPIRFSLRDVAGYGGIALADVDEFLVIRGNTIADIGNSNLDPICGIFVLHGEGIAIDGNRILANRISERFRAIRRVGEDFEPIEDLLPRPGRRGGIVLAFARSRAVESISVALLRKEFSGRRQDGVPAARVHDNIVVAHHGRALEILALGPVSVEGNQLTARGSNFLNQIPLPTGRFVRDNSSGPSAAAAVPLKARKSTSNPFLAFLDILGGAVVSIFNLGVSNEIYFQLRGFSGLSLLDNLPTQEAVDNDDESTFFIGGNILFNDNQVVLDALGPSVSLVISSVFLGCLDDVSMNANQCDCDLGRDLVLTNALTLGFSQRMADNRFKEGVLTKRTFSGVSLAVMNTTTDNQGTHCFLPMGLPTVSHVSGNRSLVQLSGRDHCSLNDELLPFPKMPPSKDISSLFPAGDQLRLVLLDRAEFFAVAKTTSLQRELRLAQAIHPEGADEIRQAERRVEVQKRFAVQTTVEIQRGEVAAPVRNPRALILHGRVVDRVRIGQPGPVVSAIGADGKARVFTSTDSNGSFRLEVPLEDDDDSDAVTLVVSDSRQAILHRGTEAFPVEGNKVAYREIVLSDDPGKPVPTPPPPVPEQVVVPDVVGLTRSNADEVLRRTGLLAEVAETQVDAKEVGLVVDQNPKGDVSVKAGSVVKLTVGVAGKTVPVPEVVGQTFAEAAATLKDVQLGVGEVEPPNPSNDGVVLGQSPRPGKQVERGSPVNLKVQPPIIEPPTVKVPNVVRLTAEDAREALAQKKLKLGKVATQPTSNNQVGLVLKQDPKAGSPVAPGSEVAILVGVKKKGTSKRSAAEVLNFVAQERDFKKIGATEAKLQRIAEKEGIKTEDDLFKIAGSEDVAAVRDGFKLGKLDNARALQEILLRVLKRG